MNIFESLNLYAFKKGEADFAVCRKNGKYGLVNKYNFLCLPYEYDHIELEYGGFPLRGTNRPTLFAKMEKCGKKYTAIIKGDAVCNVLNYQPNALILNKQFLIIEEVFTKDGITYTKQGLLNRGGLRILASEYDSIEIVSNYFAIVSKDNARELYYISQNNSKRRLGPSKEIMYGEGYNCETKQRYYYATDNNYDIVILALEGTDGFQQEYNWIFGPDDLHKRDEDDRGYDKIYFTYRGRLNNFFAVVVGNKTEIIDINGNQVVGFVIPSELHVITDTYNEGIVGVRQNVQKINSDNEIIERPYSYINSEGKILADFIYDEITKFENGEAKASYSIISGSSCGYCEQIIDINGKVLSDKTIWDGDSPNNDWVDMIDDAYEGDSDAYWNID